MFSSSDKPKDNNCPKNPSPPCTKGNSSDPQKWDPHSHPTPIPPPQESIEIWEWDGSSMGMGFPLLFGVAQEIPNCNTKYLKTHKNLTPHGIPTILRVDTHISRVLSQQFLFQGPSCSGYPFKQKKHSCSQFQVDIYQSQKPTSHARQQT